MKMRYYFRINKAVKVDENNNDTSELMDVTKYSFINPIEFNDKDGTIFGEVIEYVEPTVEEVDDTVNVENIGS